MEASKIAVNKIIEEDYKRLTQLFIREITDNWEGGGLYAVYLVLALDRKWAEYVLLN